MSNNENSKAASCLETGKRILIDESNAIKTLATSLSPDFEEVINFLESIKGKIIVCGIGKSGHISRKIASTFSSTGSPAVFLHPSEASHGDLGIISKLDCVIILSKSGESSELNDILTLTKLQNVPIISICSNADSTLVKSSSYFLSIPNIPESGDMALAPSTSSTMMLALGDAIAITLMEKKKFSKEDFHKFHPGGKLGASLLKVKDLMHTKDSVPIVKKNSLMSEVLLVMSSKNFGCACVIDNNNFLVGSITDGDLRRKISKNLLNLQADDVMSKAPKTIEPSAFAIEAVNKMAGSITSLFVVENKQIVGLLRLHDCIKAGLDL